ncbi:MAG: hypothetical protein ABR981_04825 [Candidatus Micrarchaeaceae archaeon]|jgi:DNA-directed RNA polymerase subunit F
MEIKDTKTVSIEEVIKVLEEGKESELTYEQQLALQHAKKFSVSMAKSEKLKKALEALDLLSEKSIIKILEVNPKNAMTLRQILANERKTYTDEEVNKILSIAKEKG